MLAARTLLRSNAQIAKNVVQKRSMTVIATPAREKVTKGEQIVLATAMVIGWSAIPVWVLLNIKKYRKLE